ncbi:ImmA/IrrE family metallo-endopeptidase [Paenibacillus typhae]|uniref:ImmA/IrrE family metallo-endopeptidase n=1 Tax=Paenibacillus typhae TaxID=1174501 RepID=UPI001C8EF413|nr:ImmA/IrrE family metallo-endopeptidase [Paenibacillus typhae]MBY0011463.1 ImmA/IrrE family metallo-endopeptidase [Paenibacillus typhae]
MIRHYKTTHLEDFVEQLYIQHRISTPAEINIPTISERMNIAVEYADLKHMKGVSFRGPKKIIILLDKTRTIRQQRIDFFHELGHLLRHAGNQLVMPKLFIQHQEADTEQFLLYALMPMSMIKRLDLSPDRKLAIEQLADSFTVGTELASKRYDQILRREIEGSMFAKTAAAGSSRKEELPFDLPSTQFLAYYDSTGSTDGPSQIVVYFDEWTLLNCREIEIPIGERLSEIDLEEMNCIDFVPALSSDVICFDGIVTLQIHQLLYRHGTKKTRFVINMNDVEMKIARDQAMTRNLSW